MVDIQAARAADAAARTHCPALAHQTAISPKASVISEKSATIGTGPMLLPVLVCDPVIVLALAAPPPARSAAGDADGAPIQSPRNRGA